MDDLQTVRADNRKPWEEPEVVFERSLQADAQGSGPGGSPGGFLGPLGLSPSTGGTYCL